MSHDTVVWLVRDKRVMDEGVLGTIYMEKGTGIKKGGWLTASEDWQAVIKILKERKKKAKSETKAVEEEKKE